MFFYTNKQFIILYRYSVNSNIISHREYTGGIWKILFCLVIFEEFLMILCYTLANTLIKFTGGQIDENLRPIYTSIAYWENRLGYIDIYLSNYSNFDYAISFLKFSIYIRKFYLDVKRVIFLKIKLVPLSNLVWF